MFKRIKTALSRLRPLSQQDIEAAYLAGATSLIDLELRQRKMDQMRFSNSNYTN